MDTKLLYSPEHYKRKLTEYAQDTIDYESLSGFLKYKVNKHGNPAVVEEIDGEFKIYISEKPKISLWVTTPRSTRISFIATVRIEDTININVSISRFNKIVGAIWTTYILFIGWKGYSRGDSDAFVLFLPIILFAFIVFRVQKKKFKKFVITFMNTIASPTEG